MIKKAFTIIELLVVIAIIGVLAAIAIYSVSTAKAKARDTQRINDITQLSKVMVLYYTDHGQYPADLQDLVTGGYIKKLPTDPKTKMNYDSNLTDPEHKSYQILAMLERPRDGKNYYKADPFGIVAVYLAPTPTTASLALTLTNNGGYGYYGCPLSTDISIGATAIGDQLSNVELYINAAGIHPKPTPDETYPTPSGYDEPSPSPELTPMGSSEYRYKLASTKKDPVKLSSSGASTRIGNCWIDNSTQLSCRLNNRIWPWDGTSSDDSIRTIYLTLKAYGAHGTIATKQVTIDCGSSIRYNQ